MRYLSALGAWSIRVGLCLAMCGVLIGLQAVYVLAAPPQREIAVQDTTQLWAQLLTAGVVLAVGTAVIGMFFRFKDKALEQASEDRQMAARAVLEAKEAVLKRTDEDKDALARDLGKISADVTKLTHTLEGVSGFGGILPAMVIAERRRHDLNNQMAAILLLVQEMARALGEVTGRLGVPFDAKDLQQDIANARKKNDALRNGERP
jgi:hypothetical protein